MKSTTENQVVYTIHMKRWTGCCQTIDGCVFDDDVHRLLKMDMNFGKIKNFNYFSKFIAL